LACGPSTTFFRGTCGTAGTTSVRFWLAEGGEDRDDPADPYKLIIFDCDGVLVDSEPVTASLWADMLRELGMSSQAEQLTRRFVGGSMAANTALVEEALGRTLPTQFEDEFFQRMMERLDRDVRPIDGVKEMIDVLTCPVCIASNGKHEKMVLTLTKCGLFPRFEGRMFARTDVAHAKPHPDLYLYAAAQMGEEAEDCAVVEDSVTGVTAGSAAGMTVFGYAADTDATQLSSAGAIPFSAMSTLPALLADRRLSAKT
jgi:HAD superfamily hydrolase (TIGR01509 family)